MSDEYEEMQLRQGENGVWGMFPVPKTEPVAPPKEETVEPSTLKRGRPRKE